MSKSHKARVLITGRGSRTRELMQYIIEHPNEIQVEIKGLNKSISTEQLDCIERLNCERGCDLYGKLQKKF